MNLAEQQANLRFVKVIYIDEAGSAFEEPVFTWASVIVKDRQILKIERLAKEIIETLVPKELRLDFEFHAYDIFGGNNMWARWRNRDGKALRFEILTKFIGLIRRYRLPIIECSWHKNQERIHSVITLRQGVAFSVCIDLVERWFIHNAKSDVGMLIADDQGNPRHEAIFKQEIRRARVVSRLSRKPALRHIVDT